MFVCAQTQYQKKGDKLNIICVCVEIDFFVEFWSFFKILDVKIERLVVTPTTNETKMVHCIFILVYDFHNECENQRKRHVSYYWFTNYEFSSLNVGKPWENVSFCTIFWKFELPNYPYKTKLVYGYICFWFDIFGTFKCTEISA